MAVRAFVIVSGLPASGKTLIGRLVAEQLGVPLLDKDEFLEAEFDMHPEVNQELRAKLSRKSDKLFAQRAKELKSGVLVSFWRPIGRRVSYGTSTDWISDLGADIVELHCRCSAEIALKRFMERKRHDGHNDVARYESLGQQMNDLAWLGPLGSWP